MDDDKETEKNTEDIEYVSYSKEDENGNYQETYGYYEKNKATKEKIK